MARSARHAITDSPIAAADWNSFGQCIRAPGAVLAAKVTPVAEIATRLTESFGTANGNLSQARATSPVTSAIFYTPLEREPIGHLWRQCAHTCSNFSVTEDAEKSRFVCNLVNERRGFSDAFAKNLGIKRVWVPLNVILPGRTRAASGREAPQIRAVLRSPKAMQ